MKAYFKVIFNNFLHLVIFILLMFVQSFTLCSELDIVNNAAVQLANTIQIAEESNSTSLVKQLRDVEQAVTPLINAFKDQIDKCKEVKTETDTGCFEGNNKGWNQFTSMMGTLTDVGSMTMSASCSKLANALKLGQAAQVAIRGTCAYRKSDCVEKCELALKTFGRIKSTFERSGILVQGADSPTVGTNSNAPDEINCRSEAKQALRDGSHETYDTLIRNCQSSIDEKKKKLTANEEKFKTDKFKTALQGYNGIAPTFEVTSEPDSPRSLKAACERTAQEVQSKVGMNLSNLMMTMQKNTACAKDFANLDTGLNLADCNLTGTCATTPTPNECQDPQFKDSIYCKTPTTTSLDSRGSGGGMASTKPTTPDFNLNTGNLKGLNMDGLGGGVADGPGGPGSIPDTPGPKSAGVPGGSGGGGLSIPGAGGAAPNKGGGSRGVSSDGTNYGASPGYAGGTASIGGGSGDKNKDDLQQYLPGGAKDPNLAKAGGPEGITAAGGPTIFEKVTRGYKNSRSTLIPE